MMDTLRDEQNYPNYKERFAAAVERMPLRRLGTVEDVAQACLYLASDNSYVTGQVIHLSEGAAMY
jgi:3-oxoacyl-[acyl-carrier protein] reductase